MRLLRQTPAPPQPLSPQRSFQAMITVPEGAQEGDLLNMAPPQPLAEFLSSNPKSKQQFDVSIPKGVSPGDELLVDVTWEKDKAIAVISPAKSRVPNNERGQMFPETVNQARLGIFGPPASAVYNQHEQSRLSANELGVYVSGQRKMVT